MTDDAGGKTAPIVVKQTTRASLFSIQNLVEKLRVRQVQTFTEVYTRRYRMHAKRNWYMGLALELPGIFGLIGGPLIGLTWLINDEHLREPVPYLATMNGFIVFMQFGCVLPLCIFYRKLLSIATVEEEKTMRIQIEQEMRLQREQTEAARLAAQVEETDELALNSLDGDELDDGMGAAEAPPAAGGDPGMRGAARCGVCGIDARDVLDVVVMLLYFAETLTLAFVAYPAQPGVVYAAQPGVYAAQQPPMAQVAQAAYDPAPAPLGMDAKHVGTGAVVQGGVVQGEVVHGPQARFDPYTGQPIGQPGPTPGATL